MPQPSATMTTLDAWMPFILPNVAGCPDATVLHHVRQACIEFCERTLVWREWLPPVEVDAGTAGYLVTMPVGAGMAKLLAVGRDSAAGDVVTDDAGRELVINGHSVDAVWTDDRAAISMHPIPAEAFTLELRAALKPTQAAESAPSMLFGQFARQIADGALAGLYDMTGAVWENPGKSQVKRMEFEQHIARAAAQAGKSFSRGKRQVKVLAY